MKPVEVLTVLPPKSMLSGSSMLSRPAGQRVGRDDAGRALTSAFT
jgi:hypothetical protein